MRVEILTGRTHQIRVHAAESGYVLAGDDRYGNREFNREMKQLGLKRLFLHAVKLNFPDPVNGKILEISAPLDDELEKVLDGLGEG